MKQGGGECLQRDGAVALRLMEEALQRLDRCETAFDVGAHLDLAICRLRELFDSGLSVTSEYEQELDSDRITNELEA